MYEAIIAAVILVLFVLLCGALVYSYVLAGRLEEEARDHMLRLGAKDAEIERLRRWANEDANRYTLVVNNRDEALRISYTEIAAYVDKLELAKLERDDARDDVQTAREIIDELTDEIVKHELPSAAAFDEEEPHTGVRSIAMRGGRLTIDTKP